MLQEKLIMELSSIIKIFLKSLDLVFWMKIGISHDYLLFKNVTFSWQLEMIWCRWQCNPIKYIMIYLEWNIIYVSKLVNNKSSVIRRNSIWFFKNYMSGYSTILPLCNKILTSGNFRITWGQSIICPVYKSGSFSVPSNYRGISIANTMYKIFSY